MKYKHILWFTIVHTILFIHVASEGLEDHIYKAYVGDPCVTLLNKNGGYGCRSGRNGVVGPLHLLENANDLKSFITTPPLNKKIVVIPSAIFTTQNLNDLEKTDKVLGVLVLDKGAPSEGFSPAFNMPDEKIVPSSEFSWNPLGNGMLEKKFSYPLWKLGADDSQKIFDEAIANKNKDDQTYPVNAAEITLFMHPEQNDNSLLCLRRGTCQPLGGHSTWTSIVPIIPEKEIVFVAATMDTKNIFQLKSIGANSDMSGTVALMAVLDALTNNENLNISQWNKQVVLAWLDAESWGNLGSKRLLWDIVNTPCTFKGQPPYTQCEEGGSGEYKRINLDKISSIIELKQVGDPLARKLFLHQQKHQFNTPTVNAIMEAAKSLNKTPVQQASDKTPGVPPGSLKGFIEFNETFASKGVVIADHEGSYLNKYYDSIFDDHNNVNASHVCEAATLLLRSLFILGGDSTPLETLSVDCQLVETLIDCLTHNVSCKEISDYLPTGMEAAGEYPVHYTSVYRPYAKTQHQTFVYNWVFSHAAYEKNNATCNDDTNCGEHESCINNHCQKSATYSHPALSPNVRLVQTELSIYWEAINSSISDPVWTESNWLPIGLRTFKIGNPLVDYVFLGISIVEVLFVGAVVVLIIRKITNYIELV